MQEESRAEAAKQREAKARAKAKAIAKARAQAKAEAVRERGEAEDGTDSKREEHNLGYSTKVRTGLTKFRAPNNHALGHQNRARYEGVASRADRGKPNPQVPSNLPNDQLRRDRELFLQMHGSKQCVESASQGVHQPSTES